VNLQITFDSKEKVGDLGFYELAIYIAVAIKL
jgi:hypothetical protein